MAMLPNREPLNDEGHLVLQEKDVAYLIFPTSDGEPRVSRSIRDQMVMLGSAHFQNKDANFKSDSNQRRLTEYWFTKRLKDGREIKRSWLCYSPKKNSVYCFCCLLFSEVPHNQKSAFETEAGFTKWKKLSEKLCAHEASRFHRESLCAWKELERRLVLHRTVDAALLLESAAQRQKWHEIVKRLLHYTRFLVQQNIPFRGHREHLGTSASENPGNFIALVEFLSVYDSLIKEHLDKVKSNPRKVSFLSSKVQNEFIELIGNTTRQSIVKAIKENKYFSTQHLTYHEKNSCQKSSGS
jgi:hypothetical protein